MKYYTAIPMAALLAFTLSACSNSDKTQTSEESGSENTEAVSTEVTKLRLSHFWPATSSFSKEVLEPWAKTIEEESNGRLKIELYPSASLSKPQVTYEAAVKGTVDIGSQAHGYTNGRFPLTQIAELPGLSSSATQMGCILQTLYEDGTIASEYEDSHILFMYGAGPGALHTTNKLIKTPEDMKGLRIRRPSAVAGDIIESMGASPVGLPANDMYTSLQRGVVDGLSFPWEAVTTFKIDEVTKYHTNIPFYSSGLMLAMNKDTYQGLPEDLQKVLDDNSGMEWAKKVGEVFDKHDKTALQNAKDLGHEVIEIPDPLNDPAWKGPLEKGTEKYLSDVEALGHDAQGVYEKAKAASASCKV
ncbi:TRAP transporter substrate-binding protein [Psychrobacter sp. FDAARGOS_221]|uniref:TRAP transporter substrate-binding protein n=1 Tax=Psychrobacter sp. FDAARGOS_221 TaxID=1975705 RepID=UPI000BB544AE|nr:TRAP transporter substrate-binding protein [Psychrobacter sp. FDAARGOS_221]PNK61021.1 C4-dicarboxylate ABC transporter substrate-binding protein [Psychrobacter sp. FDAARGOS_221]